jgi:hypothetical protein
LELEKRQRSPLSSDFNRKCGSNQEIGGQQRSEAQKFLGVAHFEQLFKSLFFLLSGV